LRDALHSYASDSNNSIPADPPKLSSSLLECTPALLTCQGEIAVDGGRTKISRNRYFVQVIFYQRLSIFAATFNIISTINIFISAWRKSAHPAIAIPALANRCPM
jgi:hypothetical protein